MTQAAVVVRDRSARWRNVGVAFRHRNGGGWNIQLEGGVPDETLVIKDANGYEPGTQFRLMVTRPAVSGGTDWFEVGRAWVSREGRAVLATLDVIIPAGETKLVILPKRSGDQVGSGAFVRGLRGVMLQVSAWPAGRSGECWLTARVPAGARLEPVTARR